MGFKKVHLTCSGVSQALFSTSNLVEGSIHSLLITNNTVSAGSIDIYYDGSLALKISVGANDYVALAKPINIPSETALTLVGTSGVIVLASIYEQAIDTATAMSTVQSYVVQGESARDAAIQAKLDSQAIFDNAEGLLPVGTISDDVVGSGTTYSSKKIEAELNATEAAASANTQSVVSSIESLVYYGIL